MSKAFDLAVNFNAGTLVGGNSTTTTAPGPFPRAVTQTAISLSSVWADYDNVGDGFITTTDFLQNPSSVGVTTRVGNTRAAISKELPTLNLTGKDLRVIVKCTNWAAVTNAALLLGSDSYGFSSTISVDFKNRLKNAPNNQWVELIVHIPSTEFQGVINLASINIALITLTDNGTERVTLTVNAIESFSRTNKPMLSICVDNGLITTIPGKELIESRGWTGTLFVTPESFGQPTFMTEAQVDWFADSGWDIGGHGNVNLTTLTTEQINTYLESTSNFLKNKKYKGRDLFAYPFGAYNTAVSASVEKYFSAGFNMVGYIQPVSFVSPFRINRHTIDRYTSQATVQTWVTQAINSGAWCILNFHAFVNSLVDDKDWLISEFDTLLSFIKTSNIPVVPISQAVDSLRGVNAGPNQLTISTSAPTGVPVDGQEWVVI